MGLWSECLCLSPPNLYVEIITPKGLVLGGGVFKITVLVKEAQESSLALHHVRSQQKMAI